MTKTVIYSHKKIPILKKTTYETCTPNFKPDVE